MKNIINKYKVTILRPGGNNTALIEGIVPIELRKKINTIVMSKYPDVEQVGFYDCNKETSKIRLEMAGGEFCGNATRALAYLLLNGKPGEVAINVSGTDQLLQAGINSSNNTYSYIPIKKDFNSIIKLPLNKFKVDLDGITHIITFIDKEYSPKALQKIAKNTLEETNLLTTSAAAGVMFVKKTSSYIYSLAPVVWVRDIKTLFYETACASGTTALALLLAKNKSISKTKITVLQPSKETLSVVIRKTNSFFISAYIEGKVTNLKEGIVLL